MDKKTAGVTNLKLAQILALMQEHPALPVLPMVNTEIVCDDTCSYWTGSWDSASVDHYLITDERIYFEDTDDPIEIVSKFFSWKRTEAMTDEEIDEAYEALPWKKAIIVWINPPEVLP